MTASGLRPRLPFAAECDSVCFDFQLLEGIPIEPHDIVRDTVVTEEIT